MSAELLPLVHRGPSPAEDAHGRSRLDLFLDRLSLTPRNTDMLYMADPEPLQHETWASWLLRHIRPTHSQRNTLLLLAFQTVILVLCYTTTATRALVYPLFILSTVFHEFGHALMCVVTGGHVASISVAMDESGLTSFTGGWFCAVLPVPRVALCRRGHPPRPPCRAAFRPGDLHGRVRGRFISFFGSRVPCKGWRV